MNELEVQASAPTLWQDRVKATEILKCKSSIEHKLNSHNEIVEAHKNYAELHELSQLENDQSLSDEIREALISLRKKAKKFEIECVFSHPHDHHNCFLDLNAGAGGTESHDWVEMLQRMYLRFAHRLGFKAEIIHFLAGEDAGIKSCTIKIIGLNAYGWFRSESGVHRLVRHSPFNAAGKRMTSFASVFIYPELNDEIQIQISEKDLRIDTYRASGPGGQNVNKTESAVRITHLPTGLVAQCQTERSQHQNKSNALQMLSSMLYDLEMRKKQVENDALESTKADISWGNHIRSYVLQPYQLVKDVRTNYESTDIAKILDGELEGLAYAMLTASQQNI